MLASVPCPDPWRGMCSSGRTEGAVMSSHEAITDIDIVVELT